MKIFSLSALVLALVNIKSAHAVLDSFRCLSESVRLFTKCVINECPQADQVCTFVTGDEDTCLDVETECAAITNACCMGCGAEMSTMLNCATGDICNKSIDCGGTRRGLLEEEEDQQETAVLAPEKEEPRSLAAPDTDLGELRCLSEATRVYTKCVLNNCPGADQACVGVVGDADTCDEVTSMCKVVTGECCPECQESLESLVDCATGDLCPAFDCGTAGAGGGGGGGSSTVEGGTSAAGSTLSSYGVTAAAALGAPAAALLLA